MWSENIAGRGGQEIGSCLMKHLNECVSENTKEVILYSDSCNGQNRNIKLSLLLKKLLAEHANIKIITQKFFVSGHSYNSCDRSFATVERAKKYETDIYTPDQWMQLVSNAKKSEPKFTVIRMEPTHFVSSLSLERSITNRKKDIDNVKINWREIRKIKYSQDEPYLLEINDIHVVNLKKTIVQTNTVFSADTPLECLFPHGRKITDAKYKDLMDLMKYVPKQHHPFYEQLQHDSDEKDYGLASDSDED